MNMLKKTCVYLGVFLSAVLILSGLSPLRKAQAKGTGSFKYYDYSLKKTVKYEGTLPEYIINSVSVSLSNTPALVSESGAAMASAKHVFKDTGASTYTYNKAEKKITMKYNGNKLVMYVGKNEAFLNGVEVSTGSAPRRIRYKSSKKIVTLVPTRFVFESLGYSYEWNQSTTTVTVKEPLKLFYNGEDVDYSGSICRASYNGKRINLGASPDIIISDNAMIRAKKILADTMGVSLKRDKNGRITLKKGELKLVMKLGDRHAFLNDRLVIAPVAPLMIKNYKSGTNLLYVPGRFVAENLGYSYEWIENKKTSSIEDTEDVGVDKSEINLLKFSYGNDAELPDDIDSRDIAEVFGTVNIPLPEGFDDKTCPIENRYYDEELRITLDGDYSKFYKSKDLDFTNPYIEQIAVTLTDDEKTLIHIYTNGAMCFQYSFEEGEYRLKIDRPTKFYDRIVVIDAGHGDNDPGTVHEGYNEKDLNFAIANDYLKPMFEASDMKIFLSRHDDTLVDLYERGAFASKTDADIFVSIHHNSSTNDKAHGTSVYYSTIYYVETASGLNSEIKAEMLLELGFMSNHEELMKLKSPKYQKKEAKIIFQTIQKIFEEYPTGRTKVYEYEGDGTSYVVPEPVEPGTEDRGTIDKGFVVVRDNTVPAVLLELGFMSNHEELMKLTSKKYQKKEAN
ncbi:MAG: N-acetylmuramoyl-L-alanine amidase, partial [Lachnospiraceae bacterium]|nr:N-acetylmuramoyl-L-alanine amidase [Lachnospiraceae bacterium]